MDDEDEDDDIVRYAEDMLKRNDPSELVEFRDDWEDEKGDGTVGLEIDFLHNKAKEYIASNNKLVSKN